MIRTQVGRLLARVIGSRKAYGAPHQRFANALAGAALFFIAFQTPAAQAQPQAESPYCANLRAQIARAGADARARRYRTEADRQRADYNRLTARGRALGCNREAIPFFSAPLPAECGGLNARITALRNNIASFERGASDDSQRQALSARYDAECRTPSGVRRGPKNFFEELFGLDASEDPPGMAQSRGMAPVDEDGEGADGRPRGGSMAICVRDCDGGFFPVSYAAGRAGLDDLEKLCHALCPNASVRLYTRSQWRSLDSAVSIDGEPYSAHPNALKFQSRFDAACGCRPPDKSWSEALAEAESILAERNKKDHLVTDAQAEEMSRPIVPGDPRAGKRKTNVAAPEAQTGTAGTRATTPSDTGGAQTWREIIGTDGVARRVRVVAPTL
jgi:hypothetical protein